MRSGAAITDGGLAAEQQTHRLVLAKDSGVDHVARQTELLVAACVVMYSFGSFRGRIGRESESSKQQIAKNFRICTRFQILYYSLFASHAEICHSVTRIDSRQEGTRDGMVHASGVLPYMFCQA